MLTFLDPYHLFLVLTLLASPSQFKNMLSWWECRLVQLWKTVWNFLKKLKLELPSDPTIPLLGLYSKEPMHPNVHSSVIYNSQVLGTAQVPIGK